MNEVYWVSTEGDKMNKNTVSQNAARQLQSEHADLLSELNLLQDLWPTYEEVAAAGRVNALRAFQSQMQKLRDRLVAHFSTEEQGGYMADSVALEPRLLHEAKHLLLEHGELLRAFDKLVADSQSTETSTAAWADITQRFSDFMARLRRHEAAESKLVLEAVDEDLGAGD